MNTILYFILLSILPLAYKLSFWLYVIQIKEYRYDRLKDYLKTPQGKKAVFNFWFGIEIIVLILVIMYTFKQISEKTVYYILVFLLQFESLYVFYKIFTLKFPAPKFTKRMIILTTLNILTILTVYIEMFLIPVYAYLNLIKLLVLLPIITLFWNATTGIFFDKVKERIFKQAENKIKSLNIYTIAITGSYGKSSTKEFLSILLKDNFNVIKTPKNINSEIGVSKFILNNLENKIKKSSKPSIFIAEIGAYSKGEILKMGKILNHKTGFLTGLGNQHIGLFGSQQNLVDAKFEIGEKILENGGKLYLNTSNLEITTKKIKIGFPINQEVKTPEIYNKLEENGQISSYGLKSNLITDNSVENRKLKVESNSLIANNRSHAEINSASDAEGDKFLPTSGNSSDLLLSTEGDNFCDKNKIICDKVQENKKTSKNNLGLSSNNPVILDINEVGTKFRRNNEIFQTNIIGVGLIENLIGSIKFALDNGVSLKQIKEKIKNLPLPEHTMKIYEKKISGSLNYKILYIDDSYNLSVNSLINIINTVKYLNGKKLLILDDILELGNQAHQIHQKLGEYLANKIDEIFFIGINYKKDIEKGLKKGGFKGKILDKFPYILEDYIIIMEGRKTRKYLPRTLLD